MSEYGATFDRLAKEWSALKDAHSCEHSNGGECARAGGCAMALVVARLERDLIEALCESRHVFALDADGTTSIDADGTITADAVDAALRLAAAGRREYAQNAPEGQRLQLETAAAAFDTAAKIVAGDLNALRATIPSWRWNEIGLEFGGLRGQERTCGGEYQWR